MAFTEEDVNKAMAYPGMIKSRRKIEAVISNAQNFIKIQQEFGSFDSYIWAFTEGKTIGKFCKNCGRREYCSDPIK